MICFNLKFILSFDYIFSNFIPVSLFKKKFDIVLILGEKLKFFRILYVVLNLFVIFYIIKTIYHKLNKKSDNNCLSTCIMSKDIVLKGDNDIILKSQGLFQNIMITGSIGSGKTSCAITPIVYQLISSGRTGLIIDIKGNFKNVLYKMFPNNKFIEISLDSEFKYNPINRIDLSSQEIASRLKSVLELVNIKNNSDPYWLDKAKGYLSDIITILRYEHKNINFFDIHQLVTNENMLNKYICNLKEKVLNNQYSKAKLFEINSSIGNLKNEFLSLDDRTRNIIKSEITRITDPFIKEERLYEKFCTNSKNIDFLNNVVILSLDIGKNEALTRLMATYLKIDFQKQIIAQKDNFKEVFFVCDEYQMIVNEEDAYFFSISREFKCINVVSMQSYTSLVNTLRNESSANMIIHNFINKIWFRNDDAFTVKQIIKNIGKEIKKSKSINYTQSSNNTRFNMLNSYFKDVNSGLTKGYNFVDKYDYKFSEEFFTMELRTFEAVILSTDGYKIKLDSKIHLKRWDEYENNE